MSPLALLPALPPAEPAPAPPPRSRWAQLCFPADWAAPPPPAAGDLERRRLLPRRPSRHLALVPAGAPVQQSFAVVRLFEFDQPQGRRKCSPYSRARTLALKVGGEARQRGLWDVELERLRPKTRADCIDGPRPCMWLECRYHLAISVNPENGAIKEAFPQLKIMSLDPNDDPWVGLGVLEEIVGSCALDVADRHDDGTGTSGLGGLLALRQAALSGKPLGNTPGLDIEQTGRRFNLSIERTRQISSAAMQEVRVKLRRDER